MEEEEEEKKKKKKKKRRPGNSAPGGRPTRLETQACHRARPGGHRSADGMRDRRRVARSGRRCGLADPGCPCDRQVLPGRVADFPGQGSIRESSYGRPDLATLRSQCDWISMAERNISRVAASLLVADPGTRRKPKVPLSPPARGRRSVMSGRHFRPALPAGGRHLRPAPPPAGTSGRHLRPAPPAGGRHFPPTLPAGTSLRHFRPVLPAGIARQ